jgi:hypothetical protein
MSIQVEGVVDLACVVGAAGGAWKLRLLLKPWRQDGGKLVRKLLYLDFQTGSKKVISQATSKWRQGANVVVSVGLLRKPGPNQAGWWGKPDGPLRRIRANAKRAIRAPQTSRHIDDGILGRLTLNRGMDWYEGTRKFRRNEYEVAVMTPDPDDAKKVARVVKRAAKCIRRIDDDLTKLRDDIADDLLELYNTEWRQSGRALSRAGFKKRLSLNSVIVQTGRTTAHFGAGSLFADHGIEVRISPRGKVREILLS